MNVKLRNHFDTNGTARTNNNANITFILTITIYIMIKFKTNIY